MSNMYEKVLTVISKKPDLRQEFEIQSLMPWFRKKSQLFSQLKTDYLKDIIRNCSISTFVKDDIIIKQGEIGDCFYIILGGKISIFIYNKDKDAEEEDKGLDEIGSKTPEGKLDRSKLGNFVTHLGSGVPFGEVALMSEDCIRTASIIAEERTDLLKVDRALYNRAVKDVLAREFEEKREFIKTNPLFSNWAPRYRKQLAMAMYKETFPYDCTLVRQGEQVTNMYFVISGELEIQIDPSHHQVQYPKIFADALEDSERVFKRTEKIRPPTEVQYSVNLRKKDTSKNSKMCLLGRNESVGDFEILLDLPTYMQTAVCTEKTEVLVLEMKHYERLFVKRHPRTIESMRHILKVKLDTRMNLLKSKGDIPFLNLVRKRIENFNNPKTSTEKKVKDFTSSSVAEKEFLNHKGPLIDIYGPGSVFYMIRIREKQKQRALQGVVNKQNNNGHLHSARIPQTLVLAAQMAGGTRDCDALSEKSESVHSRIVSHRLANSRSASTRVARSYRQIQSSSASEKDTVVEFEQSKEDAEAEHRNSSDFEENVAESVRSPREPRQRTFVTFPDTKEDLALKSLEDRVREWLDKNNNTRGANQVAHLRRLPLQDLGSLPKPGNKIVIRRRARTMIQDSPRNSEEKTASNSSMNMNGKIDGKIDPYQVLIS